MYKAAFRMCIEERSRPSIRGVNIFMDRCRIGRWRKSRHEKSYLPGSIASYCSGSLDERACPKSSGFPDRLTASDVLAQPTNQHASFGKGVFPIFIWEPAEGPLFYGFPRTHETGEPKVAIHSVGEDCTPSTIDRNIHPSDEAAIRSAIKFRIPALNGEVSRATTCMYTMTRDQHFIIDIHPRHPQVSIAAGFSGHGFKFSSVVGEILCDLALSRQTSSDIALFSVSRKGLQ